MRAPFVQYAGIAALKAPHDEPRAMLEQSRARRELIVDGLNSLPGVCCRRPPGAFYAFPNVRERPLPAHELADRLFEEAGVAVLAGTGLWERRQRQSPLPYANTPANIGRAIERITAFLAKL